MGSARSDDARKIAGRERRRSERIGGQMQLDVSFERNEIYECGAVLLTLLACPKELDKPRSSELFLSLCGKALWLKRLTSPDDWSPITVKPTYVFRHLDTIDRDVHFVEKRLGERMVRRPHDDPVFAAGGFRRYAAPAAGHQAALPQ